MLPNPATSCRTASSEQPKTLAELVKWSKEQALLDQIKLTLPEKQSKKKAELGSFSLVSAYDSSSDEEEEIKG